MITDLEYFTPNGTNFIEKWVLESWSSMISMFSTIPSMVRRYLSAKMYPLHYYSCNFLRFWDVEISSYVIQHNCSYL